MFFLREEKALALSPCLQYINALCRTCTSSGAGKVCESSVYQNLITKIHNPCVFTSHETRQASKLCVILPKTSGGMLCYSVATVGQLYLFLIPLHLDDTQGGEVYSNINKDKCCQFENLHNQ